MKISEMTLEELQDYAVKLEESVKAKDSELEQAKAKTVELQDLNTTLQKRNNELFLKVEQTPAPTENSQNEDSPAPQETCEELGAKLFNGGI